jgi:hypothetical protein
LRDDEPRGLYIELFGCRLDADAAHLDVAMGATALGLGHQHHVGHARQVRRQKGAAVSRGFLGAALLRLLVLGQRGLRVVGRRRIEQRQLHLQPAHRLARRALARLARELLHQLRVEVAHPREQRDDGRDERRDGAASEHVRDERAHDPEVGVEDAGDRGDLVGRAGHRRRIRAISESVSMNVVDG